MVTKPKSREIFDRSDGKLRLFFHAGQTKAWKSVARFPCMFSGTQGGKTSFGPFWLKREIDRCGPGDYLAVTATFKLLELKMQSEFLKVFIGLFNLGTWSDSRKVFTYWPVVNQPITRVIFASAANPESIESATANAAWLDEVGQKQFRIGSWEAINRRLLLAAGRTDLDPLPDGLPQGRALITTTPYGLGWQKRLIHDQWKEDLANGVISDFDVIQFASTVNPAFSQVQFDRARATMPTWRFNLFYRGLFDKPQGLIYKNFDETRDAIPRPWTKPPKDWICYVGHDFGPNNTAAIWFAQDPTTGYLWAYREYLAGGLSSAQHAQKFIELSEGENIVRRVGGALTNEDGYRDAYTYAGWPIYPPDKSMRGVSEGIDRVFGWFNNHRLFIMRDLEETIDELGSYSYELDEQYKPNEDGKIHDKAHYHIMDAMRYIIGDFRPEQLQNAFETPVVRVQDAPVEQERIYVR